jgi:hypothetical protein
VSATPQQNQIGRRAISTAEASERFQLSRSYLKYLARIGRVEGIKPGGHDWLIYEDSLLTFLDQPRSKGRGGPRKHRIEQDGQVLISTAVAHERYGYAQNYLLQLLREKRIIGKRRGRQWLIDEESLIAYKHRKHPNSIELQSVESENTSAVLPPKSESSALPAGSEPSPVEPPELPPENN